MKKLLSFLSVISLVGFTTTSVIACGSKLDNTTEEGGDNSGGDQQNTNAMIELQLKQEIGKKISSHLGKRSGIFEIKEDGWDKDYNYFTTENIEELFAQNQTTQNQWATSNFDTNTLSASNLVKDLELLINRQTLQEDLENFRTDPGYSFSLFLSGMNSSILGDVKLSQNNAIEIKWTGDEDTPTYQIRINYDVTWRYRKNGQIVTVDEIKGNRFIFTLTNDQTLGSDIKSLISTYQKEALVNNKENSLFKFDQSDFGTNESEDFDDYNSFIDNYLKWQTAKQSNGQLLEDVLNYVNKFSALESKYKINKGEFGGIPVLNPTFDFFNLSEQPTRNIGNTGSQGYVYNFLQNNVLGNTEAANLKGLTTLEAQEAAIGAYLYSSYINNNIDISNSGLSFLKSYVNNDIKNIISLVDSTWDIDEALKTIGTSIWSAGFIEISSLELTIPGNGSFSITLPTLNIPYTYSIDGTNTVSNEDQDKIATVQKLMPVVTYWRETSHKILELETSSSSTLMTVKKESELAKSLYAAPNQSLIKNSDLFDIINNSIAARQKILGTNIILSVGLEMQQNWGMYEKGLHAISKVNNAAHLSVKLGFFNIYLYRGNKDLNNNYSKINQIANQYWYSIEIQ